MTHDPESSLFDFAVSKRKPETEDEQMVTTIQTALGTSNVPIRLMRPPVAPRFTRGKQPWRRYMNIAVAAVLIIAMIGASFSLLNPGTDDGANNHHASVPPVVLGLTGQASATPTADSCDFSGDVPFFSGLDTSPVDGPAVLLTPDEDLVKVCDGETSVLLSGVKVGGPTQTPHVMIAITEDANNIINIITGEHIEIPNGGPQTQQSISEQPFGPWILSASTSDIATASIYNLATMAEVPIVAENSEPVEIASIENAVVSSGQEHIAIAIPDDPGSINSALAGFFTSSVDGDSRFVAVSDMPMPRQIAISPDGETIATSSFNGTFSGGTTTILLVSTAEGEVTQTWEMNTRDQLSELTWLRDSSMLILTDGTKLLGITEDSKREGIRVFAEASVMQVITLTPDEHVVTISQTTNATGSTPKTETLFVNVDTNEIVIQRGSDSWANPNVSATRTTLVLNQAQMPRAGDNPNLLVVDAATGEVIGEIDQDLSIDSSFLSSTWGYGDGDIVTLAFSPDSMWLLVDENGDATLEQIPSPPLEEADYQAISLAISPNGSMTLRTFEPLSVWLMTPASDEWVEIELPAPEASPGVIPSIGIILGEN